MKPSNPSELWKILIYRLRSFNAMTDRETPKIYMPNFPPEKDSMLRLRNDLDSIINEHDVINKQCSFRYYITTRHMIETISEIEIEMDDESVENN